MDDIGPEGPFRSRSPSGAPGGAERQPAFSPPNADLATFVFAAPVSVAMFDTGMRYVAWSKAWAQSYGLGARDLRGLCQYDLFSDLPETWPDLHRRVIAGEYLSCDEDRYDRADGTVTWERWRMQPVLDAAGQVQGITIFSEDITEQKRAEADLKLSETRLRLMIDSLGIGLYERDMKTGVVTASDAFCRLLGITREEVPQNVEAWLDLMDPCDHERALAERDRVFDPKGDGRLSFELHPVVNGRKRSMRAQGKLLYTDPCASHLQVPEPDHFIGILVDETERRSLEAALSRAQRLEAVGRLAGVIAHDFNNLLTVILSNLELAMMPRVGSREVTEHLRRAVEAAEMGGRFNRRLLALAGGQEGRAVTFRPDAHVAANWPIIKRLLSRSVDLRLLPGAPDVAVSMDPAELDGALLNLVVNARDAMPSGGAIRVSTRPVTLDADAAAAFAGGLPGDYICLTVSDNGAGMDAETLRQAQEPFFSTKAPEKGSGLGLASVAITAARAGGFMQISSKLGGGTSVSLFLPVARDAEGPQDAPGADLTFGNGELVLVVEDEASVREATLQRLEALGYAVIEAPDAASALAQLDAGEPVDLVLSDVTMPGGMSGFDLVAELRRSHPGVGFVLTSGRAAGASGAVSEAAREVELLRKPASLRALSQALARALRPSAGST